MNAMHSVPWINLAPKLRRPLQLWNPLDYLRLLYWVFFFPQALRWYVVIFADPRHRQATGRGLLTALRQDRVQRNLSIQGLLLAVLAPLALAAGLQQLGVPFNWFGVALDVTVGVYIGVIFGVLGGVATGVATGIAFGVATGVAGGLAFSVAIGVVGNTMIGVALGVMLGAAVNTTGFMAGGVRVEVASGMASSMAIGVLGGVLGGVAIDVVSGVAGGAVFGVTACVAIARLLDTIILALPSAWAWSWGRRGRAWRASRVVFLPLPGIQRRLEAWLAQDWPTGVHNANQLLAYTLQFIPGVRAVNAGLARLPRGQLLAAVAELARQPFDWDLVHFGSASLRNRMWNEALSGFFIVPRRLRRRWQARFPVGPRLDTPARAACAGFWYLHEGEPAKAAEAFAVVRSLPGGEELYLIAASLAAALKTEDSAAAGQWLEVSAGLAELSAPHLRPATLRTLHRLREVAAEADRAMHAASPLIRSSATGRAVTALTQLLADIDAYTGETCPQPEAAIVKKVADRWRDVLAAAAHDPLRPPMQLPRPNCVLNTRR